MANVEDRWYRTVKDPVTGKPVKERTERCGKGDRYRVRYRDDRGQQRSRSFPDKCKKQATDFLVEIESKSREGHFFDPSRGKILFEGYAEKWLESRVFDVTSRAAVETRLRNQVTPFFQKTPLVKVTTELVREWLAWLNRRKLSENYRAVCFEVLSAIMASAVEDRRVYANPCFGETVQAPKRKSKKVTVWHGVKLDAIQSAVSGRWEVAVILGVGCGLRQGEILGFSPADVDEKRGLINVVRQVRIVDRKLVFAPPKKGKERQVPLSSGVLEKIRGHEKEYGAVDVTLPWCSPTGELVTVSLLVTKKSGDPWSGDLFNKSVWVPAFKAAGYVYEKGVDGMHSLRHFYASTLLARGVSVRELAEYLGHADPGFTLRTYTHLVPSSHERAREAVDAVFGRSKRRPQAA